MILLKNMNKQKELWNKLAKDNSKYYVASYKGKGITKEDFIESGREDYKNLILNDELIEKNGIILEVGCGIGRMTQFMRYDFNKVIGIDISGKMIQQAKERLRGAEFIETDGETIPLPSNSIDFTFSYIVFQHFKTKEMLESNFKEVYRVLRKGGVFKILVRADKVDIGTWWGGVDCDENIAIDQGFKLMKKEKVKSYGLWLWLQK